MATQPSIATPGLIGIPSTANAVTGRATKPAVATGKANKPATVTGKAKVERG